MLNDVATLLNQGISVEAVCRLIEKGADLGDIGINVQILLGAGIRIDLVSIWLSNETNLQNAIAIMKQRVDLNLIGTSSEVGGLTGIMGASPNEIIARIPIYVKILRWTPDPTGAQNGMKFQWKEGGKTWNVRMHSPDPNPALPAGSNAARGWVLRVKRGSEYMDAAGTFYKDSIENPLSPNYNPAAINDTHIPIQAPTP